MLKKMTLLIASIVFLGSLSAQELTFDEKIWKMLELSGSKKNFEVAIDNMLNIQKGAYPELMDSNFFDEFSARIKEKGFENLREEIIPIYKKYLTEAEIDGIIVFYESEVGRSLMEKTPMILTESMNIGARWGQQLSAEIIEEIEDAKGKNFHKVLEKGSCDLFRIGNFEDISEYGSSFQIERTADTQIESITERKLKIEWLSENKYKLTPYNDDGSLSESGFVTVNIYEIDGKNYKYIAKANGSDYYLKGSCTKVD